jgi:glycosyltransferase involved in cell wall biosynthesis
MARAIETLLTDTDARSRLAEVGRTRAKEFTWNRTAVSTIASYERALAEHS